MMHILALRLATTMLAQQHDFYTRVFGFPVLNATSDAVTLQVGASRLTFVQATAPLPGSYHFAFNISTNQFAAAKRWLSRQVPLLTDAVGADEFYSSNWDAHMLYFGDPAGNIVELIARHTLNNASDLPFDGHSVLNISEIGVAAENVAEQVAAIQARTGAPVYRGPGSDTFAPVGDEHGLLIVVQRGRVWFPDTGKPAEHLPTTAIVAGAEPQPVALHFK